MKQNDKNIRPLFLTSKEMTILTERDNNQYANYAYEIGFPDKFKILYEEGEERLADGVYSSDLFEKTPHPMANFYVGKEESVRFVNNKTIRLKK